MDNLVICLDSNDFYDMIKCEYDDEEIYNDDLNFLLNNVYEKREIGETVKRIQQQEWRKKLINKYKKCVVSGEECEDYLEACHIMEVCDKPNYEIENGIVLTSNLHKQFDKNRWCINPNTLKIEIKKGVMGDIVKYDGKKLDLEMSYYLKYFLEKRYNKYLES